MLRSWRNAPLLRKEMLQKEYLQLMVKSGTPRPTRKSKGTSRQTARLESRLTEADTTNETRSQESVVERARAGLIHYKIFFETMVATALTVMALFLSLGQLNINKQQYTIQYILASPQFRVTSVQETDGSTSVPRNEKILVANDGYLARHVKVEVVVFFKLKPKPNSPEVLIPITDYYNQPIDSGNATGLIRTFQKESNITKRREIRDNLDELAKTNNTTVSFVEVTRYLKLSYNDLFNEPHTEYHFVPALGDSELLENEDGIAWFERHKNGRTEGRSLDFDTMTAQDLYNFFP